MFGMACLGIVACSGSEGGDTTTTTAPSIAAELEVARFSDPATTVAVAVGRRFTLVLPANPAEGWFWVAEDIDGAYLAPLGSEFVDDPAMLAQATTTTAPPPPPAPDETSTTAPGQSTITTAPTTTAPPAPTTVPGPLVQVISYAGKAPGFTQITLRYQRISATEEELVDAEEITFTVVIGNPALPPLPEGETTAPPG
jgi:hypothetical protein